MAIRALNGLQRLAVLTLLSVQACGALTSVVLIRTAKEIGVAADSKAFILTGGKANVAPVCKIRRAGHVYFSLADVVRDSATALDAYQIANEAARNSAGVEDAAKRFQKDIGPYLLPTVTDLRQNAPLLYQTNVRNASLLEGMFFGVEHKLPVVIVTFAVVDWDAPAPTIIPTMAVHQERGGSVNILWIGSIDAILRAMQDQGWRQVVAGLPPSQAALALVNIAMQADPSSIAPPIDVLRVRGNHASWVYRSRASKCRSFR